MPKAIFIVPLIEGVGPDLNLELIRAGGVEGYGYGCIGNTGDQQTALCDITSSQEVLDSLAADDKYVFLEDIPERGENIEKSTRIRKDATTIKGYLKGENYTTKRIDKAFKDTGSITEALCNLHGVSFNEYQAVLY